MTTRCHIRLLTVLCAALLGGCASTGEEPVPEAIRAAPQGDLQLVEATQTPDRHLGTRVRWGGSILAVYRDDEDNARVEVVERRLDAEGRPLPGSPSDGRFVIFAASSVDPDLYTRGGEVTVAGTLQAPVQGLIGDTPSLFPVVRVEHFVRWAPRWRDHPYYPHPSYGHPWYGPRVRFGVGIGHGLHPHPGYWYHPGHYW